MYVCVCVCVCVCTCVFVFVYVFAYVCVWGLRGVCLCACDNPKLQPLNQTLNPQNQVVLNKWFDACRAEKHALAVHCKVCVKACCSMLQCVQVRCSMLQCMPKNTPLQFIARCCKVCVAA